MNAPSMPSQTHYVISITDRDGHSTGAPLTSNRVHIGSAATADIQLSGAGIQPIHARVLMTESGDVLYFDLAAALHPVRWQPGAVIRLGDYRLQLVHTAVENINQTNVPIHTQRLSHPPQPTGTGLTPSTYQLVQAQPAPKKSDSQTVQEVSGQGPLPKKSDSQTVQEVSGQGPLPKKSDSQTVQEVTDETGLVFQPGGTFDRATVMPGPYGAPPVDHFDADTDSSTQRGDEINDTHPTGNLSMRTQPSAAFSDEAISHAPPAPAHYVIDPRRVLEAEIDLVGLPPVKKEDSQKTDRDADFAEVKEDDITRPTSMFPPPPPPLPVQSVRDYAAYDDPFGESFPIESGRKTSVYEPVERVTEIYVPPPDVLPPVHGEDTRPKHWEYHGKLGAQVTVNPVNVVPGERVRVPVSVRNQYATPVELRVWLAGLPAGWTVEVESPFYLQPGEIRPLDMILLTQPIATTETLKLIFHLKDVKTPAIGLSLPLELNLKREIDVAMWLEPTVICDHETAYLCLHNHTLAVIEVFLAGGCEARAVKLVLPPSPVRIAAGQRTDIPLRVHVMKRLRWRAFATRFWVTAKQGSRAPLDVSGTIRVRGRWF